jgi:hypothetical protein
MLVGMSARTIDGVILDLSAIIDDCWQQNSRAGFFAALYRRVTVRIKEGIESGRFLEGRRLERLDIAFAGRYIDAYRQYRQGLPPSKSWSYAFSMTEKTHPMIVQHLLLGMNAHINLDLGIAAAEVSAGEDLEELQHDFFEVNHVLSGLLDEVQSDVNESSPLYRILDRLGWQADEAICNFSIRRARYAAWSKARLLHQLPAGQWPAHISQYDEGVTTLAKLICPPFQLANVLFQAISDTETQEPRQIIEELA